MRRDVIASLKDKTGKTDKKITISRHGMQLAAIEYLKKEKILAGCERIFVERNELSLFKRWIYAVQRYKKCHEIHNVPNKMCASDSYFYVFTRQMQAIC